MGYGLIGKRFRVNEQPGERVTLDIAVLHLIGQFAIVAVDASQVNDAVLVLKDITDVTGIA